MPGLESERLLLRPPEFRDVPAITTWIGDWDVAKNLASVPHPYRESDAHAFVGLAAQKRATGEGFCFSIVRRKDSQFIGGCGLNEEAAGWELGYWLGKPFWGQGYASEAAHRLVRFAFEELGQDSVQAGWFFDNPASGHVLAKLGARHNGSRLRESRARGVMVLCHEMLLTREEFLRKQAA